MTDGDGAETTAPSPFLARLGGQVSRRRGRLIAACLATVLGPAVVAQAGSPTSRIQSVAVAEPVAESAPLPGDRATWMPVAAAAAATCPGLSAAVLIAIAQVETSLGSRPAMSAAGARGPMQFLPATWAAYGVDGDGDGIADVMNPADALHGAARLLCANGAANPDRLASALWNYNHSQEYVRLVLGVARLVPAPV